MCYQCFLAGGNSLALGASHRLGEPSLRSIPVEQLIASDFESFTKQQVLTDGVLDLYLHQPAGPVTVNGGGYGVQTIQTVAVDEAFAVFFRNAVEQLDAEIDLDFRFVDSPEAADIRFYLDSEIALGDGGLTLGIALTNDTPQKNSGKSCSIRRHLKVISTISITQLCMSCFMPLAVSIPSMTRMAMCL